MNERLAHVLQWERDNQDAIKKHRQPGLERKRAATREYIKRRMKTDPAFRALQNLRNRTKSALMSRGLRKTGSCLKLMGADRDTVRRHLESLFREGMHWENYGEWEIDHIIPCCKYDLTSLSQQRQCFHYLNLQPLWRSENRRKGGRLVS